MGKTGRLNLEMNDWMLCYVVPQSKAQESYQFVQDRQVMLVFVIGGGLHWLSLTRSGQGSRRSRLFSQRFPIQRIPNHPVKPAGAL